MVADLNALCLKYTVPTVQTRTLICNKHQSVRVPCYLNSTFAEKSETASLTTIAKTFFVRELVYFIRVRFFIVYWYFFVVFLKLQIKVHIIWRYFTVSYLEWDLAEQSWSLINWFMIDLYMTFIVTEMKQANSHFMVTYLYFHHAR